MKIVKSNTKAFSGSELNTSQSNQGAVELSFAYERQNSISLHTGRKCTLDPQASQLLLSGDMQLLKMPTKTKNCLFDRHQEQNESNLLVLISFLVIIKSYFHAPKLNRRIRSLRAGSCLFP